MGKGRWSLNDLRKMADKLPNIVNEGKQKIQGISPDLEKTAEEMK